MEGFKNAVAAVCIVSAGICTVENLVSGMRLASQVKMVLELILALVIIAPLADGLPEVRMPDFERYRTTGSTYHEELYNEEMCRQTAENIGAVLSTQISAAGVEVFDIAADVNISQDGSIYISSVTLSVSDFDTAASIVRSSLGGDTEVINGDSG